MRQYSLAPSRARLRRFKVYGKRGLHALRVPSCCRAKTMVYGEIIPGLTGCTQSVSAIQPRLNAPLWQNDTDRGSLRDVRHPKLTRPKGSIAVCRMFAAAQSSRSLIPKARRQCLCGQRRCGSTAAPLVFTPLTSSGPRPYHRRHAVAPVPVDPHGSQRPHPDLPVRRALLAGVDALRTTRGGRT